MPDNSSNSDVARILYKEIQAGDLRKIKAESNDSKTGGGARDFRFGSFEEVLPCIRLMFPNIETEERKRGSKKTITELYSGNFHWVNGDGTRSVKQSFFEPPTDARPAEGRITKVHEYPCFDLSRISTEDSSKVLLLLIQLGDETVWPYFVTENSLRTPDRWDKTVADTIISCLDARRATNRAVIGFYDFNTKESYCNGK